MLRDIQKHKIIAGPARPVKTQNCQIIWQPSILFSKVVRPCSRCYDIGWVDLELSWWIPLKLYNIPNHVQLDLSNLMKNWKSPILSETIHNPSKSNAHHLDEVLIYVEWNGSILCC